MNEYENQFMDVISFPTCPRPRVREPHKPRAPHPLIIVVSPEPGPDGARCTAHDPLTPIWTRAQGLGNNPT